MSFYPAGSWGTYYTGQGVTTVTVDDLDKSTTLALYLYGDKVVQNGRVTSLKPQEIADYIRPLDSDRIEVKVDAQKHYDGIGALVANVIAESEEVKQFFSGDLNGRFNFTGNPPSASLTASQLFPNGLEEAFRFVDYGGYPHWEDGTFIYNSNFVTLHPDTVFKITITDAQLGIIDYQMENVKFFIGNKNANNQYEDNYDYVTGSELNSNISKSVHGEYHDPFNIGRKFDIIFDHQQQGVWDRSFGASGETWTEQHFETLRDQASDWKSFGVAQFTTSLAYKPWFIRGRLV